MKQFFLRVLAAVLAMSALLCTSACGVQENSPGAALEQPEATEQSAEAENPAAEIPDRGSPDRSALAYPDAMAAYEKTDWKGSWIWTKACSEDSYVGFRKSVTVSEAAEATLYISAVDKYVLWLNGELIQLDGSVKRGPTPYDCYYDTLPLSLKAGENTIALLVAFNGRSGDSSIVPIMPDENGDEFPQAGLLFDLVIDGTEAACSDSSVKALRIDAYKNKRTAGKDYPNFSLASMLAEHNVYYDARDSIGDWFAPTFDAAAWEDATLIAKPGDLPFGGLYDAMIKPVRLSEIESFANAEEVCGKTLAEDTTLVLPLPKNSQFTFCFSLDAPAGKKLTIYTDTVEYDNSGNFSFRDTYVTAEGEQSYENYPWRSGMKLIIEAEAGVTFLELGYRISEFNGEKTPAFTSSDADLDQLWLEAQNTIAVCMRDTFMDCPERERGPYMGDASNEIDATLYGYDGEGYAMIKKAILACVAWTKADGGIPSRAPSVKPQEIPNQSLAFMSAAYHYWQHSGDVETMTLYYRACVDYLQRFEMENGLLVYRPGTWTWDDWGKNIDKELLQTGFYYYALRLTDALGEELGIRTDAEAAFFAERMQGLKNAYEAAYYTPEGFRSADSRGIDERANALLALSGLADARYYDLIASVIESTQEASPFCEKYILEAACVMGRNDIAIARIKDRYALMLTDEYDTLWENYWPDDGTVNHGWSAAPLYILSKYAAGVQPTSAGFETYRIVPSDILESYSCTVWTPKGNITVEKNGDTLTITAVEGGTLVLPDGTELALTAGTGSYSMSSR